MRAPRRTDPEHEQSGERARLTLRQPPVVLPAAAAAAAVVAGDAARPGGAARQRALTSRLCTTRCYPLSRQCVCVRAHAHLLTHSLVQTQHLIRFFFFFINTHVRTLAQTLNVKKFSFPIFSFMHNHARARTQTNTQRKNSLSCSFLQAHPFKHSFTDGERTKSEHDTPGNVTHHYSASTHVCTHAHNRQCIETITTHAQTDRDDGTCVQAQWVSRTHGTEPRCSLPSVTCQVFFFYQAVAASTNLFYD